MPKNILIFSDGTGQGGGVIIDERRSNIYKMYRATRSAPDTSISPDQQIAFYDAGLGSERDSEHIKFSWGRKIHNVFAQAMGLGITQNIKDCYAFIVQHWEEGDRVYLYGFSRGAYTARCVGGVMARCGIPTTENGQPIKRDAATARRIAHEAVVDVYQHAVGRRNEKFENQRTELARLFREKYASNDVIDGEVKNWSNNVPYFIGVWDTVAALGAGWLRLSLFLLVGTGIIAALFAALLPICRFLGLALETTSYTEWTLSFLAITGVGALLYYLKTHIRFVTTTSDPWWKTLHLRAWKMEFYDTYLNSRVRYAKHAISIDENRSDFDKVAWIDNTHPNQRGKPKDWFEQIWFAGVHSDIGGSYPETESRLSDIALEWMVERSKSAKHPILIDEHYLRIYPDAAGVQHDERKAGTVPWKLGLRTIPQDAPLHPSVIERFNAGAVVHYDEVIDYRPEPLKDHQKVKHLYK